jgi:hypothetical protein
LSTDISVKVGAGQLVKCIGNGTLHLGVSVFPGCILDGFLVPVATLLFPVAAECPVGAFAGVKAIVPGATKEPPGIMVELGDETVVFRAAVVAMLSVVEATPTPALMRTRPEPQLAPTRWTSELPPVTLIAALDSGIIGVATALPIPLVIEVSG